MKMHGDTRCWYGSGKKYKQCHEKFDEKLAKLARGGHIVPDRSLIKNKEGIIGTKKSGDINTGVLDRVVEHIRPGMSTGEIGRLVYDYTVSCGAIPAPLKYEGFPKSCCTSVNDEVCHDTPGDSIILQEGDIINVDVSTIFRGYYSDTLRIFMIGEVSEEARDLVEVTKECLNIGMDVVRPWGHVGDVGTAIHKYATSRGYSVVVDFVGHGVGEEFHENPVVGHVGRAGSGMVLAPGMVFTIESMVNVGDYHLYIDEDNGWTSYTEDGSLSAQ